VQEALAHVASVVAFEAGSNLLRRSASPQGLLHIVGKPALAQLVVNRGYKILQREAHQLIEDVNETRELGEIRMLRAQLKGWSRSFSTA
jgi:hypothetical protein